MNPILHTLLVNASSWKGFKESMTNFFQNGLGGPGAAGLGIAIASIGVVMAVVSFVVHKYNPQSRMPGPVINLLIGLMGTVLISGVGKPIELLTQARDTIMGWFGL